MASDEEPTAPSAQDDGDGRAAPVDASPDAIAAGFPDAAPVVATDDGAPDVPAPDVDAPDADAPVDAAPVDAAPVDAAPAPDADTDAAATREDATAPLDALLADAAPPTPSGARRSELKRRYRRRRLVPLLTAAVLVLALGAAGTTRALNTSPASSEQHAQPPTGTPTTDLGATEGSMAPTATDDPGTTTTADPATTVAPPTTVGPSTTLDPLGPQTPVAPIPLQDGGAPAVARIATTEPVIFVTIDDGTVRDPRVIDFLRTTGMPVTMFLNAAPVHEGAAYFDAIRQLGNTVNTHTLTHPHLPSLAPAAQHNEICGMADLIRSTYGTDGGLFRPPYGQWNAGVRQQAASCGQRATVSWMGTLNGGQLQLQEATLKPGDIILTHFRDDLYDNLVAIQRIAAEHGLRIARLDGFIPKA